MHGLVCECNAHPSGRTDPFSFKPFLIVPFASPVLPKVCIAFQLARSWRGLWPVPVPFFVFFSLFCGCLELLLPRPLTGSLSMADNLVWVSAYFPRPFRPNEVAHAYWRQQRQPGAVGTGAPPPLGMVPCLAASTGKPVVSCAAAPVAQAAPAVASPRRGSQGWRCLLPTRTMTTRAPAPAVSGADDPTCQPAARDSVTSCVRCRQHAFGVSFGRLPTATTAMMHSLAFAMTTRCGLTAGVLCRRRQADTALSLLTSVLIRSQLPSS